MPSGHDDVYGDKRLLTPSLKYRKPTDLRREQSSQENLWKSQATGAVLRYSQTKAALGANDGTKQGTVMGVVFPCCANILGVLLFLRGPWIVGLAGIGQAAALVGICCLCTFVTALSLSAVSTNGKIRGGGSYFLISRSLGPSIGAGVGLCFFFANSMGAALYIIGTVEAWDVVQPEFNFFHAGSANNTRVLGTIILVVSAILVGVGLKYVSKLGTFFLMIVFVVILSMYIGCFLGSTGTDYGLRGLDKINIKLSNFMDYDPGKLSLAEAQAEVDKWQAKLTNPDYYRKAFTGPTLENFQNNWGSHYDHPDQWAFSRTKGSVYSFTDLLSFWFPACTGIMAGSNRSAELRDPSYSIPVGTLTAQIFTSIIYISFMFVYGSVVTREYLLNDAFFASTSAWPIADVVAYGVIASSLNAGLNSMISATRLLKALSEDSTLPVLNFLRGDTRGIRGLVCSGLICFVCIMIAELNEVAKVLTMFFLICYFCVNGCCFILGFMGDANWRPTFRFYHWGSALIGMVMCLVLMFLISVIYAIVALAIVTIIMFYSSLNTQEINWGDGFRGLKHQMARDFLMRASSGKTANLKNWRPQILVLTGMTPDNDEAGLLIHDINLIHFASQLKHGHGLGIVGGIVDSPGLGSGSFLASKSTYHVRNWSTVVQKSLRDVGIDGFAEILYTSQRTEGIMTLIQTAGLGALVPNCVLVSWPFSWVVNADARRRFIQTIQVCWVFEKTVLVAKEGHKFALNNEILRGYLDIYWVVSDGGIQLLIPILLRKHTVWRKTKVRLFAVADEKNDDHVGMRQDLIKYCEEHRIQNIEVHILALDGSILFNPHHFQDLSRKLHRREDIGAAGGLGDMLTTKSRGDHVFTPHRNANRVWRVHAAGRDEDDDVQSDLGALGELDRDMEFENLRRNVMSDPFPRAKPHEKIKPRPVIPEFPISPSESCISERSTNRRHSHPSVRSDESPQSRRKLPWATTQRSDHKRYYGGGDGLSPSQRSSSSDANSPMSQASAHRPFEAPPSSFVLTNDRLESDRVCSEEVLASAKLLNSKMQQMSKNSALVVTNLPDVPVGESAFGYMQFVEHLCAGLPPVLLVRGTAVEVITAYT